MIATTTSPLLFPAATQPVVAVSGESALYPVRRVFCVGRNYADHAKEMGAEVDREAPFFFTKLPAVVASGATVPYPSGTASYHYEMELVVAIGGPAFRVSEEDVSGVIFGYAAGLDMTRRDLQNQAKDKGRPWDFGKVVENGTVIAPIVRREQFGAVGPQTITLALNGTRRQDAKLADMVWPVPALISYLSRYYHLEPGDLVYTGTPAGVGAVKPGDVIEGRIEGLPEIRLTIGAPE